MSRYLQNDSPFECRYRRRSFYGCAVPEHRDEPLLLLGRLPRNDTVGADRVVFALQPEAASTNIVNLMDALRGRSRPRSQRAGHLGKAAEREKLAKGR